MRKEILYSLLLTVIIFLVNYSLRTMIYFEGGAITSSYYLHLTEFPFKIRPFTNFSIYVITKYLNISLLYSFILHQYLLLTVFFVSFAYFLRSIHFSSKERIIGLSITAFLFPILCIHFVPVYSWDDIWSYIFIVWFLYYIIKDKYYMASLFLILAMISRESMALVLPAFYIFRNPKKLNYNWIFPTVFPLIIYGILRILFFPELLEGRLTRFIVNFNDLNAVRQSIFSLFVSFGWMWVVLCLGVKNKIQDVETKKQFQKMRKTAIIVSFITIIIVLNTALVRETRLLFTPFIFIIPFVLSQLSWYLKSFRENFKRFKWNISIFFILTLFLTSILFTVFIFPSFSFLPMIDFHRIYFALNLTISILLIILSILSKENIK